MKIADRVRPRAPATNKPVGFHEASEDYKMDDAEDDDGATSPRDLANVQERGTATLKIVDRVPPRAPATDTPMGFHEASEDYKMDDAEEFTETPKRDPTFLGFH